MEAWLLNWTSWVMRNTQAEFDGVAYDDGTNPDWFELMWQSWLTHSDYGHKLKQDKNNSYASVKISPTEYKHFQVDEAVLTYIRQLENAVNDERVRDTLKELYPRLNQNKDE